MTDPDGRIIEQSPAPYTQVAPGVAVNITIAKAPAFATVPNVVGLSSVTGAETLRFALFTPTVIYAYHKDVRTGSVIEQLPRGGDSAITGSEDVIVVSLGPGTSRITVPDFVGKTYAQVSAENTSTMLFLHPRATLASGTPDGVIVDQAPSAGTVVPPAPNIWVSVADSRAKP